MKKIGQKVKKTVIPSVENNFQPFILKPRNLFIIAVILLVIKVLIFSWFFYFPKTSQFAIITSSRLIELTNNERVASGLQPLKVNQQLVQAAQEKAQDMLNNNYFDHISPTGITPWHWLDRTGYKYITAGENLARDFTDSHFLHQAWMDSSTHRANILNNDYQEIGIAVIGDIAVQFFAKKAEVSVPVKVAVSVQETNPPKETPERVKGVLNVIGRESENLLQKVYIIVLGLIVLVLGLTVFINIRVQYPKLIFFALIFIILIVAIALFNGQEFLNRGIDIL